MPVLIMKLPLEELAKLSQVSEENYFTILFLDGCQYKGSLFSA